MISRIIEFSVRNRWLVIVAWLGIAVWGVWAVLHTPVDAIPDLSENQAIVFTDWMGRSPQDVEEQITTPLSRQLQGLAGVKSVRSSSEFGFSMITIIFDEKTDFYFARTRVQERLNSIGGLPEGVQPKLAPDATALGQIFWYTVEGDGRSLDELRAIQDYNVSYALRALPGVAEVASVGGFVREYQVDVDPAKLRVYNLPISSLYDAIAASNLSVGGKVAVENNTEMLIRGVGRLKGVADLEDVVVASPSNVPIRVKDVAKVQLGPEFRRSALEKNGREAVGGVVMMRFGQNPLEVTRQIKEKIRQIQPTLPEGVRVVPFYDRTRLIESAIHTVTSTLREEMIIASLAILLILTHLRSAIVVCITLPMAVLVSFLFMHYLDIPSNIMSLSGIAISIGILVDAAVVMVENATHELHQSFQGSGFRVRESERSGLNPEPRTLNPPLRATGDTTEIVVRACRLVGRPIFFSVLIMLISFLPVFAFGGQGGKLAHPLAFTKSFAMAGVALLAITLVPAMIPLLVRGRLKSEEQNWIVRSFIEIYRPVVTWAMDRPGFVWWLMAVIVSLGVGLIGWPWVPGIVLGLGVLALFLSVRTRAWRAAAVVSLVIVAFFADTRFRKLGSEFMPALNEGSLMDMPSSSPRIAMAQAVDDVMVRDRVLRSFPEVEMVVGKVGRADTATDPSPLEMVETVITFRPPEWWPKRKLLRDDAAAQAKVVVAEMQQRGWIKKDAALPADMLDMAVADSLEQFDRDMRQAARERQAACVPELAHALATTALDDLLSHLRGRYLTREPPDPDRQQILAAAQPHGLLLVESMRQEEVDAMLQTLRAQLISRGLAPDRADLLLDDNNALGAAVSILRSAIGTPPPTFAERIGQHVEKRRDELWREKTKSLNWELFDYAVGRMNELLTDALKLAVRGGPFAGSAIPDDAPKTLRQALDAPFAKRLLLWPKTRDEIQQEMNSELQMPGWSNTWTQPIINRVNMLATGVRTQIGVKVFGPTNKPLDEAIKDIQRVSQNVAAVLKKVPGADTVVAEQVVGKTYLEIRPDKEKAKRYFVTMADLGEAIDTAIGGRRVTTTVEGLERFPVRLRYARDYWQDVNAIGNVLITARSSSAAAPPIGGSGMRSPKAANPMPAGSTITQIPLRMVADIKLVEGPSMIKSENGRLRSYVTLNVTGRDVMGFVEEAQAALKPLEASLASPQTQGMSIEWSGEFEHELRTRQTLVVVFPLVLALILFLLYVTFADFLDTMLVFLAVLGALAGAVMFQALFGFNFSVIVSIGYIAAFGMATQTGVIMLVYLREAVAKAGGLDGIRSLDDLRKAVISGAVHRLRPKLLTEGVAIVGLVPMLWATGTGAEIMRPMAAPVLGGLLISDEVIDLMIPVLFYWLRRRRWKKLHQAEPTAQAQPLIASAT